MSVEPDPRFFPVVGPPPTEFTSDAPTHPGEVLRRELASRGMSQADLASRTGLSAKHINQVLQGSALMSADVAIALERVLGTSASIWTRLDARWQEERSRAKDEKNLREHVSWTRRFPLKELVKRGELDAHVEGPLLVDRLLQMFRVVGPEAFDRVWIGSLQGGFKRAQQYDCDGYATATWLMLGERQATQLDVQPSFSVSSLRQLLSQLRQATCLDLVEGYAQARDLLASCGVALVFVKAIPGCRASGATWWLANRPILVLSERYRRPDSFWVTLFHEIAHILLHPRRTVFIEFDKAKGDDLDGQESEAEEFAREFLVPHRHNKIIEGVPVEDLPRLAQQIGVGSALVAGRRGHLTREWPQVSRFRGTIDVGALEATTQPPRASPDLSSRGWW